MASIVRNIVFDCADPYSLGLFWTEVVGFPLHKEDRPGDEETEIEIPGRSTMFFQRVPEPKTIKNRLHVCLEPEVARDVEVERLIGIGASLVDDRRNPDGTGWAVLADPEGNEFCVLRGTPERT